MKFFKIAFFLVLSLALQSAMAATTYGKFSKMRGLRADEGDLHTTYFNSKSTDPVPTHVTIKAGKWINNMCVSIISESDDVDLDGNFSFGICAECLQALNGEIDCITEEYTNTKTGKFTGFSYQLIWDGKNYTGAIPSEHTVQLD